MDTKIRVGAVSYLNTKPLIYGFEHGMMKENVDLKIDFPSRIASMLLQNEIDVGLVPVAIIPQMEEHFIISDYCISCDGEVASVCLFSEAPLHKIRKILLDYQSRTSVELLKIIINEYWKLTVELEQAEGNYQSNISGTTAALIIGDRALQQRKISTYIYDLGLQWKKFTALPFVFATWISNKKLDDDFVRNFNDVNKYGLEKIEVVAKENETEIFDIRDYYSRYISFKMSEEKKKALSFFITKLLIQRNDSKYTNIQ